MAYFHHRERYLTEAVPSNAIVAFETGVSQSRNGTAFQYIPPYETMDQTQWEQAVVPEGDIFYQEPGVMPPVIPTRVAAEPIAGSFNIFLPGTYVICWFISQISALNTRGLNLILKRYDHSEKKWFNLNEGKESHAKVSAAHGSTTLLVVKEDLEPYGKVTFALFNGSSQPLIMNRTPHLKAALGVFGFGRIGDLEEIQQKVFDLVDGGCCGDEGRPARIQQLRQRIIEITEVEIIQDAQLDSLYERWAELYRQFAAHTHPHGSASVTVSGIYELALSVHYIRTGYAFNFYTVGNITITIADAYQTVPPTPAPTSVTLPASKVYIVTSAQLPAFTLYQQGSFVRPPTTGCCYIGPSSGTGTGARFVQVYFDQGGIFFNLTTAITIQNGWIIRFAETIMFTEIDPENDIPIDTGP